MALPPQAPLMPLPGAQRPIAQHEVNRALLLGPDGTPLERQRTPGEQVLQGWMGPGLPPPPVAPRGDAYGRAFDYSSGYNQLTTPRQGEAIGFPQLRLLARADLVALAIETRKDQLSENGGSVQPRKEPNQRFRPQIDDRCRDAMAFFRKPDKEHYFDAWLRKLADDLFIIDAPVLVRRDDRAGRLWAAEPIDGATIVRKLDKTGRTPMAPGVAYQQILQGLPACDYTRDEMIYAMRNPRTHRVYGFSPVEQIIVTINTAIRRQAQQLFHHTDGNVPEALIGLPESWSTEEIKGFQAYWDSIMADPRVRRRARFVPGQFAFQPTRNEQGLFDQFDEWIARVICYAFSLPPLPFVRMMNRATAETSYDASLREGLAPVLRWAKNIIDDILAHWFGWPDLEWVWDDTRDLDPAEQVNVDTAEMRIGLRGIDDLRAARGEDPVGIPPLVMGLGPMGFLTLEQLKRIIEKDENMPPPPGAMMGLSPEGFPMGAAPPGAPGGGGPGEADPLAGVSPELLAAFGIGQGEEPPPEGPPPEEEGWEEEPEGDATGGLVPVGAVAPRAPLAPRAPRSGRHALVRDMLRHVDRKLAAQRA